MSTGPTFVAQTGGDAPSRHRHRHGGDPVHVRQHRQAERRRAVASEHGGRREERRRVSRERRRTTRSWRRCRCRSTPASASSRRRFTPARASCCSTTCCRATFSRHCVQRARHRAHRRAAAVDPARAARVAGSDRRAPALLRQHRRPHAARNAAPSCAARCRRRKPLPDVRPDRGVPLDLPAARAKSIGGPIRSARRSRTRRSWCCAPTARRARRTSPASSCTAARWSRMGYWNDAEKTAERFKPLPRPATAAGSMLPEMAVLSGDTVRTDEEGFLYFIGRRDEMIKTSGYRVSPTEIEEVALRDEARRRSRRLRRCAPVARAGDRARRQPPPPTRPVDARSTARRVPRAAARVHGSRATSTSQRAAAAQSERQDRSQDAGAASSKSARSQRSRMSAQRAAARTDCQFDVVDDCLRRRRHRAHAPRAQRRPHAVLRVRPRTDRCSASRHCATHCRAQCRLHYAMKANPMPALVAHMARRVDGLDVASAGELRVALDAGVDPRDSQLRGSRQVRRRASPGGRRRHHRQRRVDARNRAPRGDSSAHSACRRASPCASIRISSSRPRA